MDDPTAPSDWWLDGEVISLYDGAERGFVPEVERVLELLDQDHAWRAWWTSVSKAPVLDVQIFITRPPRSAYAAQTEVSIGVDERVVRGRRRHRVRVHVDVDQLGEREPDERRLQALPTVLEAIDRVRHALKLTGEPPAVPESARPAPLSASTLRRRRLRELLGSRREPE